MAIAVLAALALLQLAAQMVRDELMPITNAENRQASWQEGRINVGMPGS